MLRINKSRQLIIVKSVNCFFCKDTYFSKHSFKCSQITSTGNSKKASAKKYLNCAFEWCWKILLEFHESWASSNSKKFETSLITDYSFIGVIEIITNENSLICTSEPIQIHGGYSQKKLMVVCGPLPKTLFMTKICEFPYPIYDLTKNSKRYLWPSRLTQMP